MKLCIRWFAIVGVLIMCVGCNDFLNRFQNGCKDTSETTSRANENDDILPDDKAEDAGGIEPSNSADRPVDSNQQVTLPPVNAPFDYQLGGAYSPPSGVRVVSRDRTDSPAAKIYNICYINGFQVQPDEEGLWADDLILRNPNGSPVIDSDWDEMLLDISTADKRKRIAAIIGEWIEDCAKNGFDAIEIDNLDSYSRSGNRLTQDQAVAMMSLLSPIAHQNQLAIAQKNSTELLPFKDRMGTDFAIAEECSRYSECDDYINYYGDNVLMIEYRAGDFSKGCSQYGNSHSIVLRDLNLRRPGGDGYVYEGC